MTWPLSANLGTRLASDLGDPPFNAWILAWDVGQMLAAARGDFAALANYWNGNIFHPAPLTLTYSEHLTGQALQILPIYAATGNIIVAYNLLFISTFALCGLAVYLLVRDLTGRPAAAFLAGLAYAYAPYRMGQFSHIQVLSSFWMPLALWGLRRYFVRASEPVPERVVMPLIGGAGALLMQHLSCGYYMLFFAPFVAAYCLYEMVQRRLASQWRVWVQLGVATAFVALATWPFVRPYLQLRELAGLGVRSLDEIVMFSADTHAFATAASPTRLLGPWLTGFFKAEGEGFPGFTVLAFVMAGLVWGLRRSLTGIPWSTMRDWHVVATVVAGLVTLASAVLVLWFFVHGSLSLTLGGRTVIYQRATTALVVALAALVSLVALVILARRPRAVASETAFGFFAMSALAAALLALGPRIEAGGRTIGIGP